MYGDREVLKFKFSDKELSEILVPNDLGQAVGKACILLLKYMALAGGAALIASIFRDGTKDSFSELRDETRKTKNCVINIIDEAKKAK